jgi:hypothetical protein
LIFGGFLIFTIAEGVAGAALVSGKIGTFSEWWIVLAVAPPALISIPILRWCYRHYGEKVDERSARAKPEN